MFAGRDCHKNFIHAIEARSDSMVHKSGIIAKKLDK
jgi:hypothetical protein